MIRFLTTEAIIKKPIVWKDISKECEIAEIVPSEDLSLKFLIESGLSAKKSKIEELSTLIDR